MTTVTITNPNAVSGTTFSWSVSAPSISGASSSSGTSIVQTLSQSTTSNKTAVYTVTPSASSCAGTAATTSVIVYAPITPGTIGAAPAICTGSNPAVITSTGSPTGGSGSYTYQWQQSSNGTSWSAASGTNTGVTYDPPMLTSSTYYRRGASCGNTEYTTAILVAVSAQPIKVQLHLVPRAMMLPPELCTWAVTLGVSRNGRRRLDPATGPMLP